MPNVSIKKNILLSTAYQILTVLTPFITAPYVSRVLEPDGIGIYSYTNSVISFFALFAVLGTASYGAREIARVRDDKKALSDTFWGIEILSIITSGTCILAWLIFASFSAKYRLIYYILTLTLFESMLNISWFFAGLEQFSKIVYRNTLVKITGIILLFLFVKEKGDLLLYITLMTGTSFLGTSSMWGYLPKMVNRINIKELNLSKHFRSTLIYFLPSIAASVYTILDKVLIGYITQSEFQNGYYEQATKIVNILKALTFSSLNAVLTSRTSYLYAQGKFDEIKERINKSLNFVFFIGFGCTFGIIAIADRFVPWFFGADYKPVILLLQVLTPVILIIAVSNILGSHYYAAVGESYIKKATKFMIIGAVVNSILNIILIPKLLSLGAIISTLMAELLITILFLSKSDGYMPMASIFEASKKKVVAGLLMMASMFILGRCITNDAIAVIFESLLGGCIYLFILLVLKDNFVCSFLRENVTNKIKYLLRK